MYDSTWHMTCLGKFSNPKLEIPNPKPYVCIYIYTRTYFLLTPQYVSLYPGKSFVNVVARGFSAAEDEKWSQLRCKARKVLFGVGLGFGVWV